ncbi:hypothetical protein ACH5RR_023504 [Cinchona calisaya]|uniref:Uncharacterized protein n=1 Tax=Cinchona calisaya TaxID=153742 RepID=A0ABD2ZES3_9GENT
MKRLGIAELLMAEFAPKLDLGLFHITAASGDRLTIVVELLLGEVAATFSLEKAVCIHGMLMMAPNYWGSKSKTLQCSRRLNLNLL